MKLEDLPEDILYWIFGYLPIYDFIHISEVCRRFLFLSNSWSGKWGYLYENYWPMTRDEMNLKSVSRNEFKKRFISRYNFTSLKINKLCVLLDSTLMLVDPFGVDENIVLSPRPKSNDILESDDMNSVQGHIPIITFSPDSNFLAVVTVYSQRDFWLSIYNIGNRMTTPITKVTDRMVAGVIKKTEFQIIEKPQDFLNYGLHYRLSTVMFYTTFSSDSNYLSCLGSYDGSMGVFTTDLYKAREAIRKGIIDPPKNPPDFPKFFAKKKDIIKDSFPIDYRRGELKVNHLYTCSPCYWIWDDKEYRMFVNLTKMSREEGWIRAVGWFYPDNSIDDKFKQVEIAKPFENETDELREERVYPRLGNFSVPFYIPFHWSTIKDPPSDKKSIPKRLILMNLIFADPEDPFGEVSRIVGVDMNDTTSIYRTFSSNNKTSDECSFIVSPHKNYIAYSFSGEILYVRDLRTGHCVAIASDKLICCWFFSPDDSVLLILTQDDSRFRTFNWKSWYFKDNEMQELKEENKRDYYECDDESFCSMNIISNVTNQLVLFTAGRNLMQMIPFFEAYYVTHSFISPDSKEFVFCGILPREPDDPGIYRMPLDAKREREGIVRVCSGDFVTWSFN